MKWNVNKKGNGTSLVDTVQSIHYQFPVNQIQYYNFLYVQGESRIFREVTVHSIPFCSIKIRVFFSLCDFLCECEFGQIDIAVSW